METRRVGLIILIELMLPGWLLAGEPPSASTVDYSRDVKPILSNRCYDCHGALKHKAGLRLDTAALMRKGGDSGPAVVPGNSDREPDRRCGHRPGRLADASRERGLAPIGRGDRQAQGVDRARGRGPDRRAPAARSARPLGVPNTQAPEVPAAAALGPMATWVRNPIDAFLAAEHLEHGLQPRPAADPATLIRRVTLDLTGLVPESRGGPRLRGRSDRPSLRGDRRQTAGQPAVWRALGPALDGRLAVQRLGRLRRRGPREPASHLAVARLDRRIAQPRHALRPDDRRHAGRRRGRPLRHQTPPRHRFLGPQLVQVQPQRLAGGRRRAHRPRRFWASRSTAPSATTTSTTRSSRPTTTPSARSSSRTRSAPTAARPARHQQRPAWCGSSTVEPATPTFLFQRGDEKHPVKDKPLAPSVPKILQSQAKLARSSRCHCRPKPFIPA